MKYFSIILIVILFIKSIYYAIYEKNSEKNNVGAFVVFLLSLIGAIFPISVLLLFY